MINIGAYDFRPMFEKSTYHTTPEEALNIAQDLKSKKVFRNSLGYFCVITRANYGTFSKI